MEIRLLRLKRPTAEVGAGKGEQKNSRNRLIAWMCTDRCVQEVILHTRNHYCSYRTHQTECDKLLLRMCLLKGQRHK